MLHFVYKKCFYKKVKIYFGKRLAVCRGDKNAVTSSLSVVENWLVFPCQLSRMGWCFLVSC